MEEELIVKDEYKCAPMGERFMAWIIDAIVVGVANNIIFFAFRGSRTNSVDTLFTVQTLVEMVFGLGLTLIYYGIFYQKKGATPGKLLFNLRVIDSEGKNLSYKTTFLREIIGKFLSGITLLGGYVMAFFTDKNRALHDMIGNTRVIVKE